MSEIATASTQYGDLQGTISLDGYQGHFLNEMARKSDMPAGYRPVGWMLYAGDPSKGRVQVYLLAEDRSATNTGSEDELSTFRFHVDMTAEDVLSLIKRVHIVAALRDLKGKTLKILDDS